MRMYDLIIKKRDAGILSEKEIDYMVQGYTKGEIPDYQMSAMMMAIYFQGLNERETLDLTMSMTQSGQLLDLSGIKGIKADKHSTGGVGDKTSLVLGPLMASVGVPVAKMSGRGLGHTGGTIDKLESFPGFRVDLSLDEFVNNVNKINIAIVAQTANLAPADKKLYALRDVTATVDNLSLIASSIMSKKLAAGADVIVLDVKTGSGAFMKTEKDAFALAKAMVKIGNGAGKKTYAIVSDMDQPLGNAVGNALEVKEAIATLNDEGPKDLKELCLVLGSYMLIGAKKADSIEEARGILEEAIFSKKALHKMAEFVEAQGGNKEAVYNVNLLPTAAIKYDFIAAADGYIKKMITNEIGMASLVLGGGRETKESEIDLSVGIYFHKKIGDFVKCGETIATLHANDEKKLESAVERLKNAIFFSENKVEKNIFIKGMIDSAN